MEIKKSINDFLEYLEVERGRNLLTLRNYHHYLKEFQKFAESQKVFKVEKIDAELIKKFRLDLNRRLGKRDSGLSKNTQNYYIIALRSFLKYLLKNNISTFAPEKIELAKTGERQITFLDTTELDAILSKPDGKSLQGIRDKAILNLLFSTGLRVSELCNLKKDDINLEKSEFSICGKGGKVRVVFLDHEAKEALGKYLSSRNDGEKELFVGYGHASNESISSKKQFTKLTPRSVQRMIKKYAKSAGITKKVTPHTMRHSFATDLLMSGADLRSVQTLLGHSSITTTQAYTHVTDKHLGEVHQAFHGIRREHKEIDTRDASI